MKRVIRFFYYLFQLERLPSRDAVISGAKQWLIGLGFCAFFWLVSALFIMHSQNGTFVEACKTIGSGAHPIINNVYAVVLGFFLVCIVIAGIVCAVAFAGLALGVLAFFAVGCWMLGSWLVHDSKRAALEQLQRLRNAFKQAWSRACGATT